MRLQHGVTAELPAVSPVSRHAVHRPVNTDTMPVTDCTSVEQEVTKWVVVVCGCLLFLLDGGRGREWAREETGYQTLALNKHSASCSVLPASLCVCTVLVIYCASNLH